MKDKDEALKKQKSMDNYVIPVERENKSQEEMNVNDKVNEILEEQKSMDNNTMHGKESENTSSIEMNVNDEVNETENGEDKTKEDIREDVEDQLHEKKTVHDESLEVKEMNAKSISKTVDNNDSVKVRDCNQDKNIILKENKNEKKSSQVEKTIAKSKTTKPHEKSSKHTGKSAHKSKNKVKGDEVKKLKRGTEDLKKKIEQLENKLNTEKEINDSLKKECEELRKININLQNKVISKMDEFGKI